MRGERIFITGGTGFFGRWLLESFAWANHRLSLGASAHVLSRSPERFTRDLPHIAHSPSLVLYRGDVRSFGFPTGSFAGVMHAATTANARMTAQQPLLMLDTIVEGTRRSLDFARTADAHRYLLTSSGAVYGRQPPQTTHLAEDYRGAPDVTGSGSAYGEGKRVAELLTAQYARDHALSAGIARCFSFVGPHLPLDGTYAVGNFLADRLARRPILVRGDGTPRRSYLYAADLVGWLWVLLASATPGRPYNVGSEREISVEELAHLAGGGELPVCVKGEPGGRPLPERYVPSTGRARQELGLTESYNLEDALGRTLTWHRGRGGRGLIMRSRRSYGYTATDPSRYS